MKLRRSTWIFVGGLAVAGLLLAAGPVNTWRLERTERNLIAVCKAKHEAAAAAAKAEAGDLSERLPTLSDDELKALADKYKVNVFELVELREARKERIANGRGADWSGLTVPPWDLGGIVWDNASCDPVTLATAGEVSGIYAELLEADRTLAASRSWHTGPVAFVVLCLSALPWAWYFLLRRIAELRSAIGGDPPQG
jgi:hypothetical protein